MYKYILVALLLAGCTKYPEHQPTIACKCKLASIEDTANHLLIQYQYDAKDRLAGRTVTPNSASMPDLKITYDSLGRPSQYICGPNVIDAWFDEWHFLYYDNKNNIVTDSVYYGGVVGPNGPVNEGPIEYTRGLYTYEYDAENRMITSRYNTLLYTYAYDANGNLIEPGIDGPREYDNKINFNRTDPFLQFLHRDYSKNNLSGFTSYNQYGLPLVYSYNKGLWLNVYPYGLIVANLTYNCKS